MSGQAREKIAVVVVVVVAAACGQGRPPLSFGVDVEDHAPWFPIAAGATHALDSPSLAGPIGCASCHAEGASFEAFSCVSCHEHRADGVDVDGSVGMNQVHRAVAGFRYESSSCLSCHATGIAAELSRAEHAPFFPIAAGTAHAVTTCAGCHVEASARAVVTCTGCHQDTDGDGQGAHEVAPMDSAHGPAMVELGYAWSTESCRSCHAAAEVPGRLEAHDDNAFPIGASAVGAGAAHAGVTCVECHASRSDRSELACTTCHEHEEERTLQEHAGGDVPGYVFESNACFACHTRAQVPGVIDHERYLPIGAGSVHEIGSAVVDVAAGTSEVIGCASCHQDPQQQRNVSCTGCHVHAADVLAPTHAAFPDYQHESSACVLCHLGGARRIEHPFFPVAAGSAHGLDNVDTADVDGLLCAECHANPQQRSQLACTSCHEHTAIIEAERHGTSMAGFGYRFEPAACFSCHRAAQVPGAFDHEPLFPLQPPSGNGAHQLACAECHSSRDDRAASLSCTSCHQPTSSADARDVHGQERLADVHGAMAGYGFTPTVCIECHVDGTAATAAVDLPHDAFPIAAGSTHALSSAGGLLECRDCHRVEGPGAAGTDYAIATLDCRACHLQTDDGDGAGARAVHGEPRLAARHDGMLDYAFDTPSCLACHPDGQATGGAGAVITHDEFPIDAGAVHTGIGCTACHGTGVRSDLTSLQCAQCHSVDRSPAEIHSGVPGFVASSPDCYRCHPDANPVGPMDHTAYFPIDTGSAHASTIYRAKVAADETTCRACHASRTDRAATRCAECHATVPPALSTTHSQVRGVVTTSSTGCKDCHADAQVFPLSSHSAFDERHEGARCAQCHQTLRSDKPFGRDFSRYSCIGCHHNDPACTATNQGPCE